MLDNKSILNIGGTKPHGQTLVKIIKEIDYTNLNQFLKL